MKAGQQRKTERMVDYEKVVLGTLGGEVDGEQKGRHVGSPFYTPVTTLPLPKELWHCSTLSHPQPLPAISKAIPGLHSRHWTKRLVEM